MDEIEPLIRALSGRRDNATRATQALVVRGDAAVPALAQALQSAKPSVQRHALDTLVHIGTAAALQAVVDASAQSTDTLRVALSRTPQVATVAARVLAWSGDTGAAPFLASAAHRHTDSDARAAAIVALMALAPEQAARVVMQLSQPWETAHELIHALTRMGKSARQALTTMLRSPQPNVRARAAQALGEVADARAVEPLCAALSDVDLDVRHAVIEALRAIGSPRAADALVARLPDPEPKVRRAAARALAALDWQPVSPRERVLYALARGNYEDLREVGTAALPTLRKALCLAEDVQQRIDAAKALGYLGCREALPILRARVSPLGGEWYGSVRDAIHHSLAQIEGSTGEGARLPRLADQPDDAPGPDHRPRASADVPLPENRPRSE